MRAGAAARLLARELLDAVLLERRTHADAVVADMDLIVRAALRRGLLLDDAQGDRAARRGELDGVGQDVEHDLVEAHGVGDDVLVLHVDHVDEERQTLCGNARLDDVAQVVHELGQVHRARLERDLAALDAAHVEHVVDEREQVLARRRGLFQVVEHLLTVVDMGGRKRGKADDRVHRRSDVVRHPGKELAFGMVGLFGGNERHTQRSLLALLFLNVFGAKEEHPPYGVKKIRP